MKIGLLIASTDVGGVYNSNGRLFNGLRSAGHEVQMFALVDNNSSRQGHQFSLDITNLNARSARRSIAKVRRNLFNQNFDVVIVSQIHLSLFTLLSRPRSSRTAIVVVEHSSPEYWRRSPKPKDRLTYRLAQILLWRADALISVSKESATELTKKFHWLKRPAFYAPNSCLDGTEPVFDRHVQDSALSKKDIVYVGRLSAEKNVDLIIRAFSEIVHQTTDDLLIVGDGPERDKLINLSEQLGLVNRIKFLGFSSDPQTIMKKSRLLVLASSNEGSPVVLIEALSQGCQVVSTDCKSGPREILAAGKFGTLVPVGETSELSRAMLSRQIAEYSREELASHLNEFISQNSLAAYLNVCKLATDIRSESISK